MSQPRVAGADALDERQPLGLPGRRWARRTCPCVGPGGGEHPLELHVGHHVGAKLKPNSPRRVASKASKPGVSTTLPTSSSIVSSA